MLNEEFCLVIEDNQETQKFLSQVVQKAFPKTQLVLAGKLAEALTYFERLRSDPAKHIRMCLVDLGLPDGSGVDFIRKIRQSGSDVPCIVTTIYDGDDHLFGALSAGASGYLIKSDDMDFLSRLLLRMEAGEPPLSPSVARRILGHFQAEKSNAQIPDNLSPRERETLLLLAQGLTVPEAAKTLGLSAQTVAGYVKIIYQKLHVSNRVELINEASRRGILKKN